MEDNPGFTKGNSKLPYWNWSIPPVKTCPGATPGCCAHCYALKSYRQYPNVKTRWDANLKLSKSTAFVRRAVAFLHTLPAGSIVRVHVSGDFYSLAYFQHWQEIAQACPSIRFYAFTKVATVTGEPRADNFILIWSRFYDDTRPIPNGLPAFSTVAKGTSGRGQQCAGGCESCGICPLAKSRTRIWSELH